MSVNEEVENDQDRFISGNATQVFVSTFPKCDVCKESVASYDAATNFSGNPWAYMCEDCWKKHGIGKLGMGKGQRLVYRAGGLYLQKED